MSHECIHSYSNKEICLTAKDLVTGMEKGKKRNIDFSTYKICKVWRECVITKFLGRGEYSFLLFLMSKPFAKQVYIDLRNVKYS